MGEEYSLQLPVNGLHTIFDWKNTPISYSYRTPVSMNMENFMEGKFVKSIDENNDNGCEYIQFSYLDLIDKAGEVILTTYPAPSASNIDDMKKLDFALTIYSFHEYLLNLSGMTWESWKSNSENWDISIKIYNCPSKNMLGSYTHNNKVISMYSNHDAYTFFHEMAHFYQQQILGFNNLGVGGTYSLTYDILTLMAQGIDSPQGYFSYTSMGLGFETMAQLISADFTLSILNVDFLSGHSRIHRGNKQADLISTAMENVRRYYKNDNVKELEGVNISDKFGKFFGGKK